MKRETVGTQKLYKQKTDIKKGIGTKIQKRMMQLYYLSVRAELFNSGFAVSVSI